VKFRNFNIPHAPFRLGAPRARARRLIDKADGGAYLNARSLRRRERHAIGVDFRAFVVVIA